MQRTIGSRMQRGLVVALMLSGAGIPGLASANHPVLVEGEQDFDGDGLVGQAEDTDGAAGDPLGLTFGTIAGCLGAVNAAINQNGTCQIVTSGNFAETVNITNQVTLEAAPGVVANIEAFLAGPDPRRQEFPAAAADANALQAAPGIVINSPANRYVILRNLTITNWTDGVRIQGSSHVLLDRVRIDHNINNGVQVSDAAEVLIQDSQITSTGFRLNPATGDFPAVLAPNPGVGLNLTGTSQTAIARSTISGGFAEPVRIVQGVRFAQAMSIAFDNNRSRELPAPMTPAPPPMNPAPAPPMNPNMAPPPDGMMMPGMGMPMPGPNMMPPGMNGGAMNGGAANGGAMNGGAMNGAGMNGGAMNGGGNMPPANGMNAGMAPNAMDPAPVPLPDPTTNAPMP
jgi:hypothetical protein